jgi:hypothetical protein
MNWDHWTSWDPRVNKWLPLFLVVDRVVQGGCVTPSERNQMTGLGIWVWMRIWDFLLGFRVGRMINELMHGNPNHLDEIRTASHWETVGVLLLLLLFLPDYALTALIRRLFRKNPGGR